MDEKSKGRTHVRRNEEDEASKSHRPKWIPSPRVLVGLVILVAAVLIASHARSVWHEAFTVLRHFKVTRLPWLLVAFAAEGLSFLCYAFVQHGLLVEGGARIPRRDMVSLAIAATGLTNLLPGGTAPASGWLVAQYRKRDIPMPLALWAVLAGGVAATVSVLLLTLVGAAIAGLLPPVGIVLCSITLVAGTVGFLAGVRHLDTVDRWFRAHRLGRSDRLIERVSKRIGDASKFRAPPALGRASSCSAWETGASTWRASLRRSRSSTCPCPGVRFCSRTPSPRSRAVSPRCQEASASSKGAWWAPSPSQARQSVTRFSPPFSTG